MGFLFHYLSRVLLRFCTIHNPRIQSYRYAQGIYKSVDYKGLLRSIIWDFQKAPF